jgi:hypothetical protein
MNKDFLTITPEFGGGGTTDVTVQASQNQGSSRTSTITISGGGITRTVEVNQAAGSITYKYKIVPTIIVVSNKQYGSVTATVIMYKETYINGVKRSEEHISYSLLEQNGGYSPVFSTTYTNSWGGTWTIEKSENSLKVTTISGGSNPSGGISGVKLMPGTSYAGTIVTSLNLGRP